MYPNKIPFFVTFLFLLLGIVVTTFEMTSTIALHCHNHKLVVSIYPHRLHLFQFIFIAHSLLFVSMMPWRNINCKFWSVVSRTFSLQNVNSSSKIEYISFHFETAEGVVLFIFESSQYISLHAINITGINISWMRILYWYHCRNWCGTIY